MKNKLHISAAVIIVASFISEVLAIVGSWIITSMDTDSGMQSLLSAEGVRWYIGSYADVLAKPLLVWILLCGCAYGILKDSCIADILKRLYNKQPTEYIERMALQASCIVGILIVIAVLLLVIGPHVILLSATGTISNSSFSEGIVPIAVFLLTAIGITYGYCSSKFRGVVELFDACIKGVTTIVPVLILYIFIVHLYMTIGHIF